MWDSSDLVSRIYPRGVGASYNSRKQAVKVSIELFRDGPELVRIPSFHLLSVLIIFRYTNKN